MEREATSKTRTRIAANNNPGRRLGPEPKYLSDKQRVYRVCVASAVMWSYFSRAVALIMSHAAKATAAKPTRIMMRKVRLFFSSGLIIADIH